MTSEALIGTPGPFEVRCDEHTTYPHPTSQSKSNSAPSRTSETPPSTDEVPRRRYECDCYETCLGLAASLNWESFTCRGCCGHPNENLMWRARVSARKDTVAARLLNAPPIVALHSPQREESATRESSSAS